MWNDHKRQRRLGLLPECCCWFPTAAQCFCGGPGWLRRSGCQAHSEGATPPETSQVRAGPSRPAREQRGGGGGGARRLLPLRWPDLPPQRPTTGRGKALSLGFGCLLAAQRSAKSGFLPRSQKGSRCPSREERKGRGGWSRETPSSSPGDGSHPLDREKISWRRGLARCCLEHLP